MSLLTFPGFGAFAGGAAGGGGGGGGLPTHSIDFEHADSDCLLTDGTNWGTMTDYKKITISAWIKPESIADAQMHIMCFGKLSSGNSTHDDLRFYIRNTSNLVLLGKTGSSTHTHVESTTSITLGVWQHVAVVFDTTQATGSDRVKFYINAIDAGGTFTTTPALNTVIQKDANSTQYSIGRGQAVNRFFDGLIAQHCSFSGDDMPTAATIYNGGSGYDVTNEATLHHQLLATGSSILEDSKLSSDWTVEYGSPVASEDIPF